jgi:hypothetical protein
LNDWFLLIVKFQLPDVNDRLCGIPEVDRLAGNGKLPPETFRLVGPNITKHLTARICSKPEAQKFSLNYRNVL